MASRTFVDFSTLCMDIMVHYSEISQQHMWTLVGWFVVFLACLCLANYIFIHANIIYRAVCTCIIAMTLFGTLVMGIYIQQNVHQVLEKVEEITTKLEL